MREKVADTGQLAAAGSCRLLFRGFGDGTFLALRVVQIGFDRVIDDRVTFQYADIFHCLMGLDDD